LSSQSTPTGGPEKSAIRSILELIVLVALALGLAFGIQAFLIKPYRIPSGSMEPTLAIGQRVLVNRIGMHLGGVHVGEIAVFHPPADAEEQLCGPNPHSVVLGGAACSQPVSGKASVTFIKRVIAGPGDEIYVKAGHVYRKAAGKSRFVREKDPYIKACAASDECNFPKPITIPAGHWFMMGDNRGDSDDSRYWGPVPTSWIIGQAFVTYWPPDRAGTF
jgi:signal peptidase I